MPHSDEIALELFKRMHLLGIRHDIYTFAGVLTLCTPEILDFGREVHSLVIKFGFLIRVSVINALLTMYFNCGNVSQAHKVFIEAEDVRHDEITYNAIIAGLVSAGKDIEAFIMFKDMRKVCLRPTELTFVSVMSSCPCARTAVQVHGQAIKIGYEGFTSVDNATITMYSSFGNLQAAHMVFTTLEEKDNITWNIIITSYAQGNFSGAAIKAYLQMQRERYEPDEFAMGSLLTSSESLVSAEMILALVLRNGLISKTQVCNALVSSICKLDVAEILAKSMHIDMDCSIWWTLFSSCAAHGNLRLGRIVAEFLLEKEENSSSVYVLLSNILADAGHWEEAAEVREMMKNCGVLKQPGYSWIGS